MKPTLSLKLSLTVGSNKNVVLQSIVRTEATQRWKKETKFLCIVQQVLPVVKITLSQTNNWYRLRLQISEISAGYRCAASWQKLCFSSHQAQGSFKSIPVAPSTWKKTMAYVFYSAGKLVFDVFQIYADYTYTQLFGKWLLETNCYHRSICSVST